MRTNKKTNYPTTHQGAIAAIIGPEQMLRRSVLSCLLWEDEAYEDGKAIADRLAELVIVLPPNVVADIAIEARNVANLRHVPLMLAALLAKPNARGTVRPLLPKIIKRADELAEFLAIYAKVYKIEPNKLKPRLSKQVQRGLAEAVRHFDQHELSKYGRHEKGQMIKLTDVLCLTHPRPHDQAQADLWKKVLDRKSLPVADTWENALMQGGDKKDTFTRLLTEKKLGYMALLRNLRNMDQSGVDPALVEAAILARAGSARVLPFRYVAAARAAPRFEPAIDKALTARLNEMAPLPGTTFVLVDVSGSMDVKLSAKSDLKRVDAAATLASMLNGKTRVFSFSLKVVEVPHRLGMAGVDAILRSQPHAGTDLGRAVKTLNMMPHDRLICITDEQSSDTVDDPVAKRAYMINVASARNGVGYGEHWVHVDGFSESVLRYIHEYEAMGL